MPYEPEYTKPVRGKSVSVQDRAKDALAAGKTTPQTLREICKAAVEEVTEMEDIKRALGPDIHKLLRTGGNLTPVQGRAFLQFVAALK